MTQSKAMSAVESIANVAIGYGVALLTQILVFPLFDIHATTQEHLAIGAIFTVVSLLRSYVLRRFFNRIRQ